MDIETLAVAKKYTDRKIHLPYSTASVSEEQVMKELPYRVKNLATVEDWSDQTGWNTGEPAELDGLPARSFRAAHGESMVKNYETTFTLGKYILIPIYIEDKPETLKLSINFSIDKSWTNVIAVTTARVNNIASRLKKGKNIIVLNRGIDYVLQGSATWENVNSIRFYTSVTGDSTNIIIGQIQTYDTDPLCTLWFDDSVKTQYSNAFTYMSPKEMPGMVCVIGDCIGTSNGLTKANIKEMVQAGWGMANHTKSHLTLTNIPLNQVEYEISKGLEYLLALDVGNSAYIFGAPQSARNDEVDKIIKRYAIAHRWGLGYCRLPRGINEESSPYNIKSYSIDLNSYENPLTGAIQRIDTAIENGLWVNLMFHSITNAPGKYDCRIADFQAIIDYLDTKKEEIKVVTCLEALYRS